MTDPTTVLYTLSTLAQTCAALAAFVGAVGLYKLQSLRDGRIRNEQRLRGLAGDITLDRPKAAQTTMDEILSTVHGRGADPETLMEWHNRRGRTPRVDQGGSSHA